MKLDNLTRWPLRAERSLTGDRINISMVTRRGVDVVSVTGEFDAFSGHLVRRMVDDSTRANRPQVVLDLSRVTFMDAGALGTIASCRRTLTARGGDLSLVCPISPALRLVRLLRLDRVWTLYPTAEQALRADCRLQAV
jgi:anti-sigma B factor antagonist